MRLAAFWVLTVVWFALVGPLAGGIVINVTVVGIPLSYAFGLIPASIAGSLYGLLVAGGVVESGRARAAAIAGGSLGGLSTAACFLAFAHFAGAGAMFNPLRMRPDVVAEGAEFLAPIAAILPWLAVLAFSSFGALGGAVCAYYMPSRMLRLLSPAISR